MHRTNSQSSVPGYDESTRPTKCLHSFSQTIHGSSTIVLELQSLAANSESDPLYLDGSTIDGAVKLNLTEKIDVKEITVKV